jgi:hypothetical protein
MKNKSKLKNQKNKVTDTFPLNKPVGKIMSFSKKESKEATGSGAAGGYSSPLFTTTKGDITKTETKESTGASSAGQYSQPSIWAKSMSKKNWRGASKTQIPGGKFVQVKKKCKKFPYCNQGDVNALKIFENQTLKKIIKSISLKYNLTENVIKNIIAYEYNLIS